jgi:preprotein translocase subunit SecG
MLHTTLMIVHFFSAFGIIALVLLQRGKGAEAGAGFGAGASGTVFGARGAGTALSRATAILAGIFMITSLSLTYVGTRAVAPPSSVLDRMTQQVPVQSAPAQAAPPPSAPASPALTAPAKQTAPAPANPAPASPAR